MLGAWSCGCPGLWQFTNSRWITLDPQYPGFDGLALGLGMVVAVRPCLPKFSGQDLPSFVDKFARFLRLSGLQQMSDQVKTDWLIQACEPQVYKIVVNTVKESQEYLEASLTKLGEIFPALENDLT